MNYESLTGHTCSGCSPELLDRYLKVISRRGAGEDAYRSELEDYQFELSVMAFRTKDKLRFTDRSVFNRAAFACLSGIGGGRQLDVGDLARDRRKLSEPIGFPRLAAFSGRCRILVRGDVMHNRDPHMPCLLAHAIRVDIPQSMEPRSPEPLVHGLQDRADDREIGPPSEHPDGEAVAKRKE